MAKVTGFTAEKMLEIENSTVVDGEVIGNNLDLITRGGTHINAGNVRGPMGPIGDSLEIGDIIVTARTTKNGYLLCDGRSVSRTTYADLFAVIGTTYGSVDVSSFNIPDLRNRMPAGAGASYPLGSSGGAPTHTLNPNEMPLHNHGNTGAESATHVHYVSNVTDYQGDHGHTLIGAAFGYQFVIGSLPNSSIFANAGEDVDHGDVDISFTSGGSVDAAGNHAHNFSSWSGGQNVNHVHATANAGANVPHNNMPPYMALNYMIKHTELFA